MNGVIVCNQTLGADRTQRFPDRMPLAFWIQPGLHATGAAPETKIIFGAFRQHIDNGVIDFFELSGGPIFNGGPSHLPEAVPELSAFGLADFMDDFPLGKMVFDTGLQGFRVGNLYRTRTANRDPFELFISHQSTKPAAGRRPAPFAVIHHTSKFDKVFAGLTDSGCTEFTAFQLLERIFELITVHAPKRTGVPELNAICRDKQVLGRTGLPP